MWVDPDSGKTWEQVCETVWQRLSPAKQASLEACAAASGTTRAEIIREAVEEAEDRLERDPRARERYAATLEHEHYPFGRDPRLRQKGEA